LAWDNSAVKFARRADDSRSIAFKVMPLLRVQRGGMNDEALANSAVATCTCALLVLVARLTLPGMDAAEIVRIAAAGWPAAARHSPKRR